MTRLYIDVYSNKTYDPYELARKMNALVSSNLPNNTDLRMGTFHPIDKTTLFYQYKAMTEELLKRRENDEDEDALLEEMDDVWWKLPIEERKILNQGCLGRPHKSYKPKDVVLPPTRFKINQIVKTGPDEWQIIHIEETKMIVQVLNTGVDVYGSVGSYLDTGKKYELFRHSQDSFELWEICPEMMKRSTSQILLYWWPEDDDPMIDLDF